MSHPFNDLYGHPRDGNGPARVTRLCGCAASAAAPTRSPHSVVLFHREAARRCIDATQSRKDRHHTSPGRGGQQSSLQPTARSDHECHRVFQTDGSTGHRRSLPAGLDRAGQRPIPPAALAFVAPVCSQLSIVRTGSRPSGCPRPMRRGWLRRNRLTTPPPAHGFVLCGRGWMGLFASVPRCFYFPRYTPQPTR
jgi:hypothetical protein